MGVFDRLHGAKSADTDMGPSIAQAVRSANQAATEIWGRPGGCPRCGGHGYLDRIDVIDRIQYEHCIDCSHKWSVAEADTIHV